MHHIYHTKAFVLSSYEKGEANKILVLFTRELGLIRALATGIRLNKSKLRFSFQDFSFVDIDLVKGKEIWRTTTGKIIDSFPVLRTRKESFVLVSKVSRLIERFCGSEEPQKELFDETIKFLEYLNSDNVDEKRAFAAELLLVLRIMKDLGYVENLEIFSSFLNSPINDDLVERLLKNKKIIISHINKALVESQL